ncbi:N-acetyltransferase [Agaricicola taiwanensis]|uniref:N-acetyltransferase n=1 Tax=Agaricicola taiwanensis TaxID=591372 RepID=A0A8J2YES8_9RHOB|nr:GNAT family protein [Agaricicola taiwanensis]GGE27322.1 N-acetyltransferase [Agaricicola taiwanensis]
MTGPAAIRLANAFVALEPLSEDHRAGLAAAAADPVIWKNTPLVGGSFDAYWQLSRAEQANGTQVPFAVRRLSDAKLVGMSRLFDIAPEHKRLEIGWTWYAPETWGTAVNPATKRLLLAHCIETWGARRVQFLTDNLNVHSQTALRKLGATFEGVLRAHRIRPDGSRRDSHSFSILPEDWPRVRDGLDARLQAFAATT